MIILRWFFGNRTQDACLNSLKLFILNLVSFIITKKTFIWLQNYAIDDNAVSVDADVGGIPAELELLHKFDSGGLGPPG